MRILPGKGWPPAGSESCASPAVTQAAKRRQRVWELCDRASKGRNSTGPSLFRKAAAASLRLIGLARGARPGSKSRASTHGGSPRNLGGPDVSVKASSGYWAPREKPWPWSAAVPASPGSEPMGQLTVPPSEGERSAAGRASGSRSALIVPRQQGNRPAGPCGGKRGVGTWTYGMERWRGH